MRLVIDGRRLTAERTGVGRYLETLLAEWARTGPPLPRTVVALHDPAGLERVPECEGLRTELVCPGWPGLAWERFGLGRLLRPGDLLFAPTNLIPVGWRGRTVLALFDALLEARPDDFPRSARWRFRRRYRLAARRADLVIVPSEATARDAEHHYRVPPDRIRVIYPAPEPAFRPLPPDSEEVRAARSALGLGDDPFFLFVGKRSRRRNVPSILAAFARHRGDFPNHRLAFVGPASAPITAPGVVEAGHVPEPILRGLLASAVALLYPSEYEGFGLPVVEAMACGCPVVTLRRGALLESGGEAAVFLDSADPGPLADAMTRLVADPVARNAHTARGVTHAARFRVDGFAEAVRDAIFGLATDMMARPVRTGPGAFARRVRHPLIGVGRAD